MIMEFIPRAPSDFGHSSRHGAAFGAPGPKVDMPPSLRSQPGLLAHSARSRRPRSGAGWSTASRSPISTSPPRNCMRRSRRRRRSIRAPSTFQALADRGLIQVQERGLDNYPHIRITPVGRKLVRSWTGQKAYKAPPAGTLREWHWRALAAAYAAGERGLPDTGGGYTRIGWSTWQRLEEFGARAGHRGGTALTQVRRTWPPVRRWDGNAYHDTSEMVYDMVITDAGHALYERE